MNPESEKTIKKYEEILKNEPGSSTFVFLAQTLYKRKELDRAIGVLIKGLRYNKNNITGRFLLGKIYYERWMIEPAKKELETVFELAPDNLAAGKMLEEIYRSEENYEKAHEVLSFVYEFHPGDQSIVSKIEELSLKIQSRPPEPWENFSAYVSKDNNSTSKNSDNELNTETIADIYIKQGDYEKGLSVLEKMLEDDPDNQVVRKKLSDIRLEIINRAAGFGKKE